MPKEAAILNKVFAGHDSGFFGLPRELLARRDAERRVQDGLRVLNEQMRKVQPADVKTRIVIELIAEAGVGDLPEGYGAPLLAEQKKLRVLSAEHTILTEARDLLVEGTPWLAMRLSEDILANHLRPAMETVLGNLRSRADLAASVPWGDTRALLRASEEAREYHEQMVMAAEHYAGIRDAQERLRMLTGNPSEDAFYHFGQLRNMEQVWPSRGAFNDRYKDSPPWPEDPLARMAWLVTSEADPWMPTAAECEAAYAERLSGVTVVRGLAVPTR